MKTYLIKDQVRLLKRKTSITRQSVNPVYNCKIKYSGCEVHNSELLVSSNVNTYTYIRQFLSLTAILIHAPVPAFFRLYICPSIVCPQCVHCSSAFLFVRWLVFWFTVLSFHIFYFSSSYSSICWRQFCRSSIQAFLHLRFHTLALPFLDSFLHSISHSFARLHNHPCLVPFVLILRQSFFSFCVECF